MGWNLKLGLWAGAVVAIASMGCSTATQPAQSVASGSARKGVALEPERPMDLIPGAPSDAIVAVHRAKCGACHMRVEPGSVSRSTLESALLRHRGRARLTERQWEEMVDYLSADGLAHARSTAENP